MNQQSFIVLKIEKLTRAIYLVTDFMSDSEPLKWRLRHLVLDSLSIALNNKDIKYFGQLVKQLPEIISLIDLGLGAGTVSTMNFNLLRREYTALLNNIEVEMNKNLGQSLKVDQLLPEIVSSSVFKDEPVSVSNKSDNIAVLNNSNLTDKDQRQAKIISHLKGKGWLSIKDIADTLPGFSSKTVQRELLELVDHGLLRKKGERRWSRYSLAQLTV
ncbi:MAG: hypothetical protein Q7T49_01845 [bacterium]|nr:hypothetical protein [bacterium]